MNTNDSTWPFPARDVSEDQPDMTPLYEMIERYFSDNTKVIITPEEMNQIDLESTMYEEVGYSDFFAIANELFGAQRASQFTTNDYNEWLSHQM
jgi:hypothetical protein